MSQSLYALANRLFSPTRISAHACIIQGVLLLSLAWIISPLGEERAWLNHQNEERKKKNKGQHERMINAHYLAQIFHRVVANVLEKI